MKTPAFTLTNPTLALDFVLTKHRDAFFAFLLTDTPTPTSAQMKRAIDLVVSVIGEEYANKHGKPLAPSSAQFHINGTTAAGIQNLYVTQFFCHFMTT